MYTYCFDYDRITQTYQIDKAILLGLHWLFLTSDCVNKIVPSAFVYCSECGYDMEDREAQEQTGIHHRVVDKGNMVET